MSSDRKGCESCGPKKRQNHNLSRRLSLRLPSSDSLNASLAGSDEEQMGLGHCVVRIHWPLASDSCSRSKELAEV